MSSSRFGDAWHPPLVRTHFAISTIFFSASLNLSSMAFLADFLATCSLSSSLLINSQSSWTWRTLRSLLTRSSETALSTSWRRMAVAKVWAWCCSRVFSRCASDSR